MKQRCTNPKHIGYKYWGGRGIKVCEAWQGYKVFRRWAQEHGYEKGLTIDRKDNDGDYCPENCHWITRAENSRKGSKPLSPMK